MWLCINYLLDFNDHPSFGPEICLDLKSANNSVLPSSDKAAKIPAWTTIRLGTKPSAGLPFPPPPPARTKDPTSSTVTPHPLAQMASWSKTLPPPPLSVIPERIVVLLLVSMVTQPTCVTDEPFSIVHQATGKFIVNLFATFYCTCFNHNCSVLSSC